jgi:hypothetical protein
VADPWWSSKGSLLQRSNHALHRCLPLPHETTLSNSKPSRVSPRSVLLRLAEQQISTSRFLSAVSPTLFRTTQSPVPSAVLHITASATLDTAASLYSISIGPAFAANTGGFLLTA